MKLAVYLINLDGSDERLASARAQLDTANVPFDRVSAFDGRGLSLDQFPDYDAKAALFYMGRPLRGGEIGCYLSHLDCARRFLASDAQHALVLEDDMQLAPGAMDSLSQILLWLSTRPIAWDVINIGANRLKYTTPWANFPGPGGGTTLLKAHYFPMTTTAIIWSRQGAADFVAGHRAIYAPVDNFLREWQCIVDRGLSVTPPLVTTTGAESDIDGGQAKRKAENRHPLYGWLKQKRVWRNKFRALRHMVKWRSSKIFDK
jgi:glycosyl transferase family 25